MAEEAEKMTMKVFAVPEAVWQRMRDRNDITFTACFVATFTPDGLVRVDKSRYVQRPDGPVLPELAATVLCRNLQQEGFRESRDDD